MKTTKGIEVKHVYSVTPPNSTVRGTIGRNTKTSFNKETHTTMNCFLTTHELPWKDFQTSQESTKRQKCYTKGLLTHEHKGNQRSATSRTPKEHAGRISLRRLVSNPKHSQGLLAHVGTSKVGMQLSALDCTSSDFGTPVLQRLIKSECTLFFSLPTISTEITWICFSFWQICLRLSAYLWTGIL